MTTPSIPDLMREARADEEHWLRVLATMATDLERLEDDAWNPLRAQSFEPAESHGLHLWCIEHDQLLNHCENDANDGCVVGEPEAIGGVSDPTFAAIGGNGAAKGKLNRAKRLLEARRRNTASLEALLRPVELVNGEVLAVAGRQAEKANVKPPEGCGPCGAHGSWAPPLTQEPTDVGGRLPRKELVCRWHFDFVTVYGELPTDEEEERHKAGKRVTRRVRQTDRLRRGVEAGRLG